MSGNIYVLSFFINYYILSSTIIFYNSIISCCN